MQAIDKMVFAHEVANLLDEGCTFFVADSIVLAACVVGVWHERLNRVGCPFDVISHGGVFVLQEH